MQHLKSTTRSTSFRLCGALAAAFLLATLLLVAPPAAAQGLAASGAVFTATNDADANAVVVFRRDARGGLTFLDAFATGGAGSGGGLGNQGALALDEGARHLLVVNAGSDTLSSFAVGPRGLELVDVEPSGGTQPISVTVQGGLAYVVHAGSGDVSGLALADDGTLSPLAGSTRPLSGGATGPAQIAFTPDGR
ncbi:MAG TPA: hypothetical protein VKU40_11285, partial [Thermoanaerobaculia bacterium]|nr:hypothetical protein [Thermoanaerobaculia bacterium]